MTTITSDRQTPPLSQGESGFLYFGRSSGPSGSASRDIDNAFASWATRVRNSYGDSGVNPAYFDVSVACLGLSSLELYSQCPHATLQMRCVLVLECPGFCRFLSCLANHSGPRRQMKRPKPCRRRFTETRITTSTGLRIPERAPGDTSGITRFSTSPSVFPLRPADVSQRAESEALIVSRAGALCGSVRGDFSGSSCETGGL